MVHTTVLPPLMASALQDTPVPVMSTPAEALVPYMLAPVTVRKPPAAMGQSVRAVAPLTVQPVIARPVIVGAAANTTVLPVNAPLPPPLALMAVMLQLAAAV